MSDAWMCGRGLRQHPRLRTPAATAPAFFTGKHVLERLDRPRLARMSG